MTRVQVTAKRDFLKSLAASQPIAALAELIWNGFDAGSDKVQVFLELNDMDGIESIRVRDSGCGINHSEIEKLFGSLGDSWKKSKARQNGRALHGKNGKGRFKAFALGELVEWETVYKIRDKAYTYKILGNAQALDNFETTEPSETNNAATGTEVRIYNVFRDFRTLKDDSPSMELAKIFGAYLTEHPSLRLEYESRQIDPLAVQHRRQEYDLGGIELSDGKIVYSKMTIVEWNFSTDRAVHLCDADGVSLHELPGGMQIRAPGFFFTTYVKSDHFRELDKSNVLCLSDMHADVQTILKVAKGKLREHFRHRLAESQSKIVERWKEERIYPYEDKVYLDPVEIAERQVFDILAVNVQSYLPSFEEADAKSKKFTFRLLAQAIRENPDSVQMIIGEVLGLKKEAQDDLADLLSKTPLSSIISTAKVVANRLDFLNGLESLIFDKDSKKKLLERDQLHKILEKEAWLFHEEFALAGSEQRLEEVLHKHISVLGKRDDDPRPVEVGEGGTGRVDLMLQRVIQPRTGEYDYLIVELKRPSKKIDSEVLIQIEKYAMAVANDERFRDVPARWTFVAVSNELDSYAKKKASQRGMPKGQVYSDSESNITVWVRAWADVINDARGRLRFINEQLSYEADRDSAKAYLKRAHAKFIPDLTEAGLDGTD